ncbi:GDSL-type esterase/lipase family protein [Nocardia sp. CC227C]|uniref:GDSL-type esterase/lipase family protein n=1 Tax=Nocardia sp. CC227C TaxID=3044562 RepID=UPI00278BC42D|nr:GDSL-type esterase/lipase family protein [Nocardia sp. CC227C]
MCFVGESFVAGVGDQQCLGWAGRLAVRAIAAGQPLTYYNLGVRRETSTRLHARWLAECAPRLPAGCDGRLVLSTGVNDTMHENGRPRVPLEESVANLAGVLDTARAREWSVLVVAPPPVADAAHTDRIAALDERFATHCDAVGVPYLRVHTALRDNRVWMAEVAAGDGAHPGAAGYDEFAELSAPYWLRWLGITIS